MRLYRYTCVAVDNNPTAITGVASGPIQIRLRLRPISVRPSFLKFVLNVFFGHMN